MKTRIYIVDDHALFRSGLAVLINSEADMEVCGEGEDCAVATQQILKLKPDIVVVDITLRGNNGIELIKNVRAVEPRIQFIVLSMHDESVYALRVLRVGAKAYVMKQDASSRVVEAIRTIRKGQLYVSEDISSQMLNRYAQGEELNNDSPVASLSDRELEVLNLIGSAVPTSEIAQRLHVSIKTVETHRAHLKTKLNLATAAQLIQFAVRWVDQSEHVDHEADATVTPFPAPAPAAKAPQPAPAPVAPAPAPVPQNAEPKPAAKPRAVTKTSAVPASAPTPMPAARPARPAARKSLASVG